MKIFKNKILLVTGGTGSFGNAVLKKFLKLNLKEIRIFSRDEKKQDDMRKLYKNKKIKFYLGDVRNKSSVDIAMKNVDYVFHAAALKQVPSCEFYPLEAINTNIIGANNVITSVIEHGVKKAIFLSTDKAVYPINSMGMSKALMEKIVIARSRDLNNSDTVICATRYGNVMASRGSVIPLFFEQVKKNKKLTITSPNMTRFLMSLEESVELVLEAFKNGKNGEIFVYKSPACSIENLAKAIIKMSKSNSKISYIGTRHGEKLFETLVSQEEMLNSISNKKFFKIIPDNRDLDYSKYYAKGRNKALKDAYTSHNTNRLNVDQIIDKIKSLNSFDYKKYV
ncbi:polysaccharide biosynthesis protein [Candidatus Pelagibacter sp.]|jgi:UDP-glucose 4-epimerase|nr:polysaccharide biosynthesis protein [Candidatus Pelagibacter sp.]